MTRRILAIDGPAASGKGTLARRLAAHLGWPHLDTGLLYRAVGMRLIGSGFALTDATAATHAAASLTVADLGRDDLRGEEAARAASAVAAVPAVRATLLAFQRSFAAPGDAVLDGRDIGTVVFPHAWRKLWVTASVVERARRRALETGRADRNAIEAELRARDAADAARPVAPMLAAADAVVLDTTTLDPGAAFAAALAHLSSRAGCGAKL